MKGNLKELSFYFVTQTLIILSPIIYIPLVSSFLTPDEFGKVSLFLMLLSFSSQLFYGPISNGINKFYYHALNVNKISSLFIAIENVILVLSFIIFSIICLFYFGTGFLRDFSLSEVSLIYFTCILFGIYVIYNGILGVKRDRSKQMLLEFVINISKLSSVYLLFLFLYKNNISVVLSYLISLIFGVIILYKILNYRFIRLNSINSNVQYYYLKVIKFAIPFSIWAPFLNGYFLSDRFLIKHFFSLSDLGNYSIQYQLTFSSMQLLTSLISGFLLPVLLQKNEKKKLNKRYSILFYFSLIFICFGLLGGIFMYEYGVSIFHIFLKKNYLIIPKYLLILTLSGSIYGASQILAIKQTLQNRNTKLLYCNILLSIVGFFLNYIFSLNYGIIGLVYSLLIMSLTWYFSILIIFKLE